MASIASFTINDGAATPVAHTFSPVGKTDTIAKWQDKSGGITLGFPTVTLAFREPTKTSRSTKVSAKIVLPVLEVTSPSTASGIQPAPTLAYNLLAVVDVVIPDRASAAEKASLYAYLANFINLTSPAFFRDAVKIAEPVY